MIKKAKVISSSEYKQLIKPKKNKYGNKRVEYDGIKFDSIGEKNRYIVLKSMEERNIISDLKLQVTYDLKVNNDLICRYRADFVYIRDGFSVTEDLKGVETPEFKLKKKLMKAIHGIDILLTCLK